MGNQIGADIAPAHDTGLITDNINSINHSSQTTNAKNTSDELKPHPSSSKPVKNDSVGHDTKPPDTKHALYGGLIDDSPQVQLWRTALMQIKLRNVIFPPNGVKHFCFVPDEKLDYTRLVRVLRPEVDSWFKVCVPSELSRNDFWRNLFFNLQCLLEEIDQDGSNTKKQMGTPDEDNSGKLISKAKQSSTAMTDANNITEVREGLGANDMLSQLITQQKTELAKMRKIVLERTWVICKWCRYTARAIDVVIDADLLMQTCEGPLTNLSTIAKIVFEPSDLTVSSRNCSGDSHACGQHTGSWSLSQDAQDFLSLDETLKKQFRDQKKRRLEDVNMQLAWIPDTDDVNSMIGKWTCCGQDQYQSKGCLKKDSHEWEITTR